jgi:hypothetical protein
MVSYNNRRSHIFVWAGVLVLIVGPMAASAQVETKPDPTNWQQSENTFSKAATAPLDDLNVRQIEIPPILILATQNIYALTAIDTCAILAREIGKLDAVLGPDLDAEVSGDDGTLTERGESFAHRTAISTVRDASSEVIPFRGIVRKISGAQRHQAEVEAAIMAGTARRSFLKGIGMAKNCSPPAAPANFVPKRRKLR